MATNNTQVTAYLPDHLLEYLTNYCTQYGIVRKKDSKPLLATGIVDLLTIVSTIPIEELTKFTPQTIKDDTLEKKLSDSKLVSKLLDTLLGNEELRQRLQDALIPSDLFNAHKTLPSNLPVNDYDGKDDLSSNVPDTLLDAMEVRKDDLDPYVKNLNKHIEVKAVEVKNETKMTEDERIGLLKQGYSIVFDCHKGKDEKIKQYINFKPEESLSTDKWVYVGTKTHPEWTENSIYGNYTGEKDNKIACEKFAVELKKSKQLQAEALKELTGKALGCWCYPSPCHGQVLADFVNNASKNEQGTENLEDNLTDKETTKPEDSSENETVNNTESQIRLNFYTENKQLEINKKAELTLSNSSFTFDDSVEEILKLNSQGLNYAQIAKRLTEGNYPTAKGKFNWIGNQVKRILTKK